MNQKDFITTFQSFEHHGVSTLEVKDHYDTIARIIRERIEDGHSKGSLRDFVLDHDMQVLATNPEVKKVRESLHYLTPSQWKDLCQSATVNPRRTSQARNKKREIEHAQSSDERDINDREKMPNHQHAITETPKPKCPSCIPDSTDGSKKSQYTYDKDKKPTNWIKEGILLPDTEKIYVHIKCHKLNGEETTHEIG